MRISAATVCPKVRKPYTPERRRERGRDERVGAWEPGGGPELTGERVDDQTKDHGEHRDEHPVGELLVLHAAVDGYAGFVALRGEKMADV